VLWHYWLGVRKGIRPVKKLGVGLLVMIWLELCTTYSSSSPVVTTTSIILCFNKHWLTQVHLEKWPLKWTESQFFQSQASFSRCEPLWNDGANFFCRTSMSFLSNNWPNSVGRLKAKSKHSTQNFNQTSTYGYSLTMLVERKLTSEREKLSTRFQ